MSNRWFVGKKRGLMHAADPRFPWLSCQFPDKIAHFGKNHTFTHAPPVLFFPGGKNVPRLTLHCYAERFLPGIGLPAPFLGQFGSSQSCRVVFLQTKYDLHRSVAASLMYSSSESGTESQGVCNLRQGWKVRSCSIDAQSFGNQAQYINLCPAGGKLFGNHFHPFLISTPRRLDEVFFVFLALLKAPHSVPLSWS